MGKVLVLGAGMVTRPMVRYLLEKGHEVTVASRTVEKAERMVKGFEKGKAVAWTVDQEGKLDEMVKEHDVAVSMLPYAYHVLVAKMVLKHRKHLVTTSYVKENMKALDGEARERGVLLLNEIGLDPGIDHMSAMEIINDIKANGGKVRSFKSLCGALPAPEFADNPFKYKFSWSPKGVVLAATNDGRYRENGKEVYVPTEKLFDSPFYVKVEDVGELEVYPNRDSIPYATFYHIEDADTIFRGTLRYPGWCEIWSTIKRLNLLDPEEKDFTNVSYLEAVASQCGAPADVEEIRKKVGASGKVFEKLEYIGLFSDKLVGKRISPLDLLVELLLEKLSFKEGEKDMIVLHHIFEWEKGEEKYLRKSTMVYYGEIGEEKDTAVALTVALPAAVAVNKILAGEIKLAGVYIPTVPEIYEPVLDELDSIGFKFKEEEIQIK